MLVRDSTAIFPGRAYAFELRRRHTLRVDDSKHWQFVGKDITAHMAEYSMIRSHLKLQLKAFA
jgi:hypothetical protein